ncbi:nuclear transport factor 2 family protein [Kutzneria sp. NPDC051319]|uniref:YybH family protein n=1 Tax=Kutzneria sp. NPDC051319 TaxID=3155047 RepID=UPI00343FE202
MTTTARTPEDISRLFVELANAGDVDGMANLYEEDAVLAFPPGSQTVGRAGIRELMVQLVARGGAFTVEEALPTIYQGDDLALTSTVPSDNTGGRVQLVRRQADGSWLRVIDRPETRPS